MERRRTLLQGLPLAFLAAFALWLYVRLERTYVITLQIPLQIELPSGLALAATVPSTVVAYVQGSGWQMLGLQLWERPTWVTLAVPEVVPPAVVGVGRQQLLRSLSLPGSVTLLHLVPDTLTLRIDRAQVRTFLVASAVRFEVPKGFVVAQLQMDPERVAIRGALSLLDSITAVSTAETLLVLRRLDTEVELPVVVKPAFPLQVRPGRVRLRVNIQPEAEVVIEDVPVEVVPAVGIGEHQITPRRVRVWLRGPLAEVAKVSVQNVQAVVPYEELLRDSTGVVSPRILVPPRMEVFRVEPPQLFHWRRREGF